MAWLFCNSQTAHATIYGMHWNKSPPQYASIGDTFEVSATYYEFPSGTSEAGFCISDPNFPNGSDPNHAGISWGTERIVAGKRYQPITITSIGNGSLSICAVSTGGSGYAHVDVGPPILTLSNIVITGNSEVVSGCAINLTIKATANDGSTLSGGTQSWSVSPSSYASISQSGLLFAQTTVVWRIVAVTATYTYLGISKTNSKEIVVIPQLVAPVITPEDGTVFDTVAQKVSISTTTPDALIYFTTNGISPTTSNTLYAGPFNIYDSAIIMAIAVKSGYGNSAISTSSISKFRETVERPLIVDSFISGTTNIVGHQLVSISCDTEGAIIHYTLNNDIPDGSSPLYNSPLEIFETTTINAIATKSEFITSEISSLLVSNVVSLADALNLPTLNVVSAGWTTTTNASQDGIYSTFSGTTSNNSTNTLSASIDGAGRISFWWKASCEDDDFADNWDYLVFIVDGKEKQRIDGITSWQQYAIYLPQGTHEFRWEYRKDSSSFAGDDCGWLDNLSWVPCDECATTNSPSRVPYAWLDKFGLVNSNAYEAAANALCANGYFAWESYLAGLDPTNSSSKFIASIAISNGQPKVTWTPDLGSNRVYTIYGKTSLLDSAWITPTNNGNRFFKVTAESY